MSCVGRVRDDDRDVVGAAAAQRERDQPLDALLRVDDTRACVSRDGLGADHAGEPVAADQVAVAAEHLAHRVLGVDVAAVERPGEQRPLRVAARLLGADPTLVDQHLDVGVVLGDLRELAVAQHVGPRVADVHHADLAAGEQHGGQRGAHALELRVGVDGVAQLLVGGADGAAQRVDEGVTGDVLVERGHGADDDVAGDVTGGHAAHAVGDGEQPRSGVDGVLVSVPDQTAVAAGRVAQGQCHGRNSSEVRPIRIGTPRGTGVGPVTLARSRYVPLVEPRSSTNHCPSRARAGRAAPTHSRR